MINGELIDWSDTYIYGEKYQVSNTGIIRNKLTGKILNPNKDWWQSNVLIMPS